MALILGHVSFSLINIVGDQRFWIMLNIAIMLLGWIPVIALIWLLFVGYSDSFISRKLGLSVEQTEKPDIQE